MKKLAVALFLALLILPTVVWFSARNEMSSLVPFDFASEMKREKTEFPAWEKITTGTSSFFNGVEQYYGDRMPFFGAMMTGYRKAEAFANEKYGMAVKAYTDLVHKHRYTEEIILATCTEGGKTVYICRCGDRYEDHLTDPVGHSYKEETVPATCIAAGYTLHSCTVCGESYTDNPTEITDHDYVSEVIAPTCTAEGYTLFTCSVCGDNYKDRYTDPTGHTYTETVVAPTCTEQGYTLHACECGDSFRDNYTDAAGHTFGDWTAGSDGSEIRVCVQCGETEQRAASHTHSYTEETVAPTCTEQGYTLHTCACGDSYKDNYTDAVGHTFGEWNKVSDGKEERVCTVCGKTEDRIAGHTHSYTEKTVAPTCTEQGYTLHTCACGGSFKDNYTDSLGHDFGEWELKKPSTETEKGLSVRICRRCGNREERVEALLGHTHSYAEKTVAPTCTKRGYVLHSCACGDTYKDQYTKALGHTFGEWQKVADGKEQRICSVCGEKETRTAPVSHVHFYEEEKRVAPTCTEDGYIRYVCSCGDAYSETLKATGHHFTEKTFDPTCTEAGRTEKECSVCHHKETTPIPALNHDFRKKETVEASCQSQGYDLMVCSRCSAERKENIVQKKAHSFGSWTETKTATCSEYGERTRECSVCHEKETEQLPKIDPKTVTGTTRNGYTVGAWKKANNPASSTAWANGYAIYNSKLDFVLWTGEATQGDYLNTIGDFTGSNTYSTAEKKNFAKKLQALYDKAQKKGITVLFTVVPNKETVYSEFMSVYRTKGATSRVGELFKYLEANTTVPVLYQKGLDDLNLYRQTYELWFRHDTHWNAAGGFVWAQDILDTLGLPSMSLYDVPLQSIKRTVLYDSMYNGRKSALENLKNNLIASTVHGSYDHYGDMDGQGKNDIDFKIDYLPDTKYDITWYNNPRYNGDAAYSAYYSSPEYTNIVTGSSNALSDLRCTLFGDSFRRSLNLVFCKTFKNYASFHYNTVGSGTDHTKAVASIKKTDVIIIEGVERVFNMDHYLKLIDTVSAMLDQ